MGNQQTTLNAVKWRVPGSEYDVMQRIVLSELDTILATVKTEQLQQQIFMCLHQTFRHRDIAQKFNEFVSRHQIDIYQDLNVPSQSRILRYLTENENKEYRDKICEVILQFIAPLIKGMALSLKYANHQYEFIDFIISTYHRWFVNHHFVEGKHYEFSVHEFLRKLGFRNDEASSGYDEEYVKQFVRDVIESMHKRFAAKPVAQPAYKIRDSLTVFQNFFLTVQSYLNGEQSEYVLSGKSNLQIDVCVIPRDTVKSVPTARHHSHSNAMGSDNDNDDDDDEVDETEQKSQSNNCRTQPPISPRNDCRAIANDNGEKIGDIADRLKENQMEYYVAEIAVDEEWSNEKLHEHLQNFVNAENVITKTVQKIVHFLPAAMAGKIAQLLPAKPKPFKRFTRYIMIYDRRSTRHQLYIFEAKPGFNCFASQHFGYLFQFQSLYYSKQCILPAVEDWPEIGAFHSLQGRMFCVSYHLHDNNRKRAYWCTQGSLLRLYASDVYKVWPAFFEDATSMTMKSVRAFPDETYARWCQMLGIEGTLATCTDTTGGGGGDVDTAQDNLVQRIVTSRASLAQTMSDALNARFRGTNIGALFLEIVDGQGFDEEESIVDDVQSGRDSILVDALIEQHGEFDDNQFEEISQVLRQTVESNNAGLMHVKVN